MDGKFLLVSMPNRNYACQIIVEKHHVGNDDASVFCVIQSSAYELETLPGFALRTEAPDGKIPPIISAATRGKPSFQRAIIWPDLGIN